EVPGSRGAGEPVAAPDGGRITAFQGSTSHQRPPRVRFVHTTVRIGCPSFGTQVALLPFRAHYIPIKPSRARRVSEGTQTQAHALGSEISLLCCEKGGVLCDRTGTFTVKSRVRPACIASSPTSAGRSPMPSRGRP